MNKYIPVINAHGEIVDYSDGYHRFTELYQHRIELWIALTKKLQNECEVWRSHLHSDGTSFSGWFILGITLVTGEQLSYHLPDDKWDQCSFAVERIYAPPFDGHTPQDVLNRLKKL